MKKKNSSEKSSKRKNLHQNYWAISTVVLAAILIVTLLTGSTASATVSAEEAGQKVLDFAINQGAEAELISSTDDGSLYEVVLSIE